METVVFLAIPFALPLACLGFLLTPWGRKLARRGPLAVAGALQLIGGAPAIPSFADPDGRFAASAPFVLAYGLIAIVWRSYFTTGASRWAYVYLLLFLLGATLLLLFAWGWTGSCAMGICV